MILTRFPKTFAIFILLCTSCFKEIGEIWLMCQRRSMFRTVLYSGITHCPIELSRVSSWKSPFTVQGEAIDFTVARILRTRVLLNDLSTSTFLSRHSRPSFGSASRKPRESHPRGEPSSIIFIEKSFFVVGNNKIFFNRIVSPHFPSHRFDRKSKDEEECYTLESNV